MVTDQEIQEALDQIERNDVDGAETLARRITAERGAVSPALLHYLWMLQDDPAEFERRVADVPVAKSPSVE